MNLAKTKRACHEKAAKYPDLEKTLLDWICSTQSSGYIVTMAQIRFQALKFCNNASFKASQSLNDNTLKHACAMQ